MKVTRIALRNIGRNRRRSVLSATAVAVATASIVMLFALLEGMEADMRHNLTTFFTGEVRLRHPEYGANEHLMPLHLSVSEIEPKVAAVRRLDVVAQHTVRLAVPGAVFQGDEQVGIRVIGVDPAAEASYSDIGDYVAAGSLDELLSGTHDRIAPAAIGAGVPDRLGIQLGDSFTVVSRTAQRGTNARTFRAVATLGLPVQALNETTIWAPLPAVQQLARLPAQAGEILLRLHPEVRGESDVAAALEDIKASVPGVEVMHFSEMETSYAYIEMASAAYTVIALFFFVLASTVIVNTTMMIIHERRREIGTLSAMGMDRSQIVGLFFTEALAVGAIGAGIGLALGTAVGLILGRVGINLGAAMEGVDFEISTVVFPVLNLRSTLVVFAFAVLVCGITSYFPTRRAADIQPVAALREE